VALALLTVLAVVAMHALDHEAAHQSLTEAGGHEEHRDRDSGKDAGDREGAASPASSACAFVMLVPAAPGLYRCGIVRRGWSVAERGVSRVTSGPEPPVPRRAIFV